MFFRSRPTFEDSDIALTLPGKWTRSENSRPDLLIFREASGQRQLSVSVLSLGKPEESHQAVQSLYSHRVDAERRELAAGDPIIAEGVQVTEGKPLGVFSGVQKASSRFFTGYVTAAGAQAVVLYLESIIRDPRAHLELAMRYF
jgi:hypothetical protein